MVKLKKTLLKSGNLLKFDAKQNSLSFLILETETVLNCLQLPFIKTPIFWHIDFEYHIWIKIDELSYIINNVLI